MIERSLGELKQTRYEFYVHCGSSNSSNWPRTIQWRTIHCTKFERNNLTADRCYAKQHVNKQNSSNRQGGFSGFALTASLNGSMDIVIDCGCTNHILPGKSMFQTLSLLKRDGSAMFITNGDGTQQRVHGVGEVCLSLYDRKKVMYTFNLQRAFYVPSFKYHLIFVSLPVKQGNTVILNQNPHMRVGQRKAYFIERDGLFWFKHCEEEPNMSALSIAKWHARFSQANCETLKRTANQAVKGMVISGSLLTDNCTTCLECIISTSI